MKKMLVTILVVLMMPVIAYAQGTYSISELHEMYDRQRWQGEYYTARNETITVDAPFLIPDVDAAPVLLVSPYPELDPSFVSTLTTNKYQDTRAEVARTQPLGYFSWMHRYEFTVAPDDMTMFTYNPVCYLPEEMSADVVAENNPLNMMEAYDRVLGFYDEILNTYGIGPVKLVPRMAEVIGFYRQKDGKPLSDHCGYHFEMLQALRGIPILYSTNGIYPSSYKTQYKWEMWMDCPSAYCHMSSPDCFLLGGHFVQESEELYADIPLTDFSQCQEKLVSLIEAGLVRQVRKIHLAYSLYAESSHDTHKTYRLIAVPTWIVDCEYYPSKDKAQIKVHAEANYYHNSDNGFNYLMFNAQTGEYLDLKNTSKTRSDAPKIITWKKVKKR